MPPGPRSTARPGAGPGRGRARARNRPRTEPPAAPKPVSEETEDGDAVEVVEPPRPRLAISGRRSSITTRAIALAVVLLILTISYASSLRIYFAQAEKITATRVDIADRQERIAELQAELGLWKDPAFVKQQARDRLGWVVPGEIGFRVIGPDGKPLGGGAEIAKPASSVDRPPSAWWQRLQGSVQAADKPAPSAPTERPADKPITEDTEPR